MTYPKVENFLSHLLRGTKVCIEDDMNEENIFFEGTVMEYFESEVSKEDLTLLQSYIRDNVLCVRAVKTRGSDSMLEFEYCQKCKEVLTDEDTSYQDLCEECGIEEESKE